jgi:hypothetical protein
MVDQKSPAVKICCIGAGYVGGALTLLVFLVRRASFAIGAHAKQARWELGGPGQGGRRSSAIALSAHQAR